MKVTLKTVFNVNINGTDVTVWSNTKVKANEEGYSYFVKVVETSKLPKGGTTAELSAITEAITEALGDKAQSVIVQF